MSWARRSRPVLVVHAGGLALLAGDANASAAEGWSEGDRAASDLADRIRASSSGDSAARAKAGTALRVLVSDRWLQWVTLPWTADLISPQGALAQCDVYAQMTFGAPAANARYAWGYAPFGGPQCAVGLHPQALQALRELAAKRNYTVESVRPLSLACWEQHRAAIQERHPVFCVLEREAVTVLVIRNRRVERVLTQLCQADPGAELHKLWRRMRLREPHLQSAKWYAVDLTDGAVDPAACPEAAVLSRTTAAQVAARAGAGEFDFTPQPAPLGGWRMALLAVGLVWLGISAVSAQRAYVEGAALRVEKRASGPGSGTAGAIGSGDGRRMRAQIRAVNQAITSLNLPVGALLRSLQPPGELHTALLGLDLSDVHADTRSAAVKITAESRTGREMTSYVEFLSRAELFDAVFLTRHEVIDAGAEKRYRYVVEASWRP